MGCIMSRSLKLSFKKGDWLAVVFVVILALSVAVFFLPKKSSTESKIVQIYQNNQLISEYPLNETTDLLIEGEYCNTVQIREGKVAIVKSDCPGADCVHSGWINASGRSIVCLPNKVEIRIIGVSDEVDFVVG